jgi:class 3 adenylate cyclase
MAAAAMGIMLPTFVTDRIVAAAKAAQPGSDTASDSHSTHSRSSVNSSTEASFASTATGGGHAAVDFGNTSAVWTYPNVCVMFIDFSVDTTGGDLDAAYGVIRRTIADVEDAVSKQGVLKVKTAGTTMLCMLGTDDALSIEERITTMVAAARAVHRNVFAPLAGGRDLQSSQRDAMIFTLRSQIGIHCGPAFGAVIGSDGFIFDIFGDTVNMASRMMSTAAPGTIQLSDSAERARPLDRSLLRFDTVERPDVAIKGGGLVDTHIVIDAADSGYSPMIMSPIKRPLPAKS